MGSNRASDMGVGSMSDAPHADEQAARVLRSGNAAESVLGDGYVADGLASRMVAVGVQTSVSAASNVMVKGLCRNDGVVGGMGGMGGMGFCTHDISGMSMRID